MDINKRDSYRVGDAETLIDGDENRTELRAWDSHCTAASSATIETLSAVFFHKQQKDVWDAVKMAPNFNRDLQLQTKDYLKNTMKTLQ